MGKPSKYERGKIEADRVNRERMERRNVRVATKKDMEI